MKPKLISFEVLKIRFACAIDTYGNIAYDQLINFGEISSINVCIKLIYVFLKFGLSQGPLVFYQTLRLIKNQTFYIPMPIFRHLEPLISSGVTLKRTHFEKEMSLIYNLF